jgi:hypothetical protein
MLDMITTAPKVLARVSRTSGTCTSTVSSPARAFASSTAARSVQKAGSPFGEPSQTPSLGSRSWPSPPSSTTNGAANAGAEKASNSRSVASPRRPVIRCCRTRSITRSAFPMRSLESMGRYEPRPFRCTLRPGRVAVKRLRYAGSGFFARAMGRARTWGCSTHRCHLPARRFASLCAPGSSGSRARPRPRGARARGRGCRGGRRRGRRGRAPRGPALGRLRPDDPADIRDRLAAATATEAAAVELYESTRKSRRSVLDAAERALRN